MVKNRRIGIDMGGTKIEGVILEGSEIVERVRVPTESSKGYDHILNLVADLILGIEKTAGPGTPIGVGMPGSVTREGKVKNSNTLCLNGTYFRQELRRRLDRSVAFANDANCFALAEATLGAGKGHGLVFGVILGTGVGGGLVIDGRVREGPQSICGEWGHMALRPESDRACYCGKKGCVESFLSGPAIERTYREEGGEAIGLAEVLERRVRGEAAAVRCVQKWLDSYGMAVANLINVLDPDAVVLGGGVSNADCLYDEGRERVARYIFSDELTTPILRHELGDSAGVLGAALLNG